MSAAAPTEGPTALPLDQAQRKRLCDQILQQAAEMMVEVGAPVDMIVDRLVTYAIAQVVANEGKEQALKMLGGATEAIMRGVFDQIDFNTKVRN